MNERNSYWHADLHAHTSESDGVYNPEELLKKAIEAGLKIVGITDHNTFKGAEKALEAVEKFERKIIAVGGIEDTTKNGEHVLGLYLNRLPSQKKTIRTTAYETVKRMHADGALVVVPHLGGRVGIKIGAIEILTCRFSLSADDVDQIYQQGETIDGIETYHPLFTSENQDSAFEIAERYGITVLGTNDDHYGDIGRGGYFTGVPKKTGNPLEDLKSGFAERGTILVKSELEELPNGRWHRLISPARSIWIGFKAGAIQDLIERRNGYGR